jgi:hypothetical protein
VVQPPTLAIAGRASGVRASSIAGRLKLSMDDMVIVDRPHVLNIASASAFCDIVMTC